MRLSGSEEGGGGLGEVCLRGNNYQMLETIDCGFSQMSQKGDEKAENGTSGRKRCALKNCRGTKHCKSLKNCLQICRSFSIPKV